MGKFIDLSGQQFGELTVIARSDVKKSNNDSVLWECHCDCGKTTFVATKNLNAGNNQSCGCQKSRGENLLEEFFIKNQIILD